MLNPLSNAFGLDIGDRSYKLVQLGRPRRSGGQYRLKAWGIVDVPEGVMDNGNIVDRAKAAELVNKLVKSSVGHVSGRTVVACLPETKTFIKVIETKPNETDDQVVSAVLKEIEENIPLPKEEIYYDWQVMKPDRLPANGSGAVSRTKDNRDAPAETADSRQDMTPTRVLIGAAPKQLVDDFTAMIDLAGLAPAVFEIEAMAISRAILPLQKEPASAVGLLDIGATRSSLIIYDRGTIQMSLSIPISGAEITEIISRKLKVSLDDAEKLKRECGLDANRCEDKIWRVLLPQIDDMTLKIRNALRFYKIGFPHGSDIERLLVTGGGANFREIDSVLSRKLTIKVERADPLTNVRRPVPKRFPSDSALTYVTAIGLAVRAADETSTGLKGLH
ncbi:MAG: pilus assembly protein PilM [bacterium]